MVIILLVAIIQGGSIWGRFGVKRVPAGVLFQCAGLSMISLARSVSVTLVYMQANDLCAD